MDIPVNIVEVMFKILSWGLVIYLIYHMYQKQEMKPVVWKACAATYIGMFTFNINLPTSNPLIQIPILPLGVWMLLWYASSRAGAWERYRRFAWLGFTANFIFIAATVLTVLLHHAIYPKSNLSTYIANYEDATIVQLHPSAKDVVFDKESFEQLYLSFVDEPVNSIEWYNNMFEVEPKERVEHFPYQLSGTTAKWGSGLPTLIYIEQDGKGILIDSSEKQRYFRSNEPILKGGHEE